MISPKLFLVFFFWLLGFIFLWKIPTPKRYSSSLRLSPKISILIPARNEEKTLGQLLHSIAQQSLKPFEVIVIDDQSEDATAEVARNAGCIVLTSRELPIGWTGKPWACWQGAQRAMGDLFLFLNMVPIFVMPDWMKTLSHFTPHAWALTGYHDVMIRGLGVKDILTEMVVLLGFATSFFFVALWRFRFH